MDRVERALALYMVVALRIARLMRLGRTCPDLDASLLFDADEIRGAYVLAKKARPKTPVTLNQMIRLVASLGGFLGRKSDGEPGAKTIWIGMQRTMDAALTIQALQHDFHLGRREPIGQRRGPGFEPDTGLGLRHCRRNFSEASDQSSEKPPSKGSA